MRYMPTDENTWMRVFLVVAYLWLAALVAGLYFHQTEISKQEAARAAERNARVAQCVASIPQLKKIDRFVDGVRQFHMIIAMNSRALVQATPTTDPQYKVRLANYRRVLQTVADVSGVRFHVPTRAECHQLGQNPR